MLNFGNKEFRNLQEQVLENMKDIQDIMQGATVLADFGIKVVGQVEDVEDLPDPSEYEGDYGDAYMVGTETPYDYYIFTRAFEGQEEPSWFNLGQFPVPGPQGPAGQDGQDGAQGPQGIQGPQGPQGPTGLQGPQGPQGERGATGATGPQGPKGDTGTAYVITGQVDSVEDLPPDPSILARNAAYLVGTEAPYDMYVLIQGELGLEWFNAGSVTIGPEGPQGPQGPQGPRGYTGEAAGFGNVTATAEVVQYNPTARVSTSGDDDSKNFAFTFGLPKNISLALNTEVSSGAPTVKSISIDGDSYNFESASNVAWGSITGTLSNQTDLQTALTNVANSASNAANDASSALSAAQAASSAAQSAYNAANDAASAASNAANDASNAASVAESALNAANSKSTVTGTNDGTNWTYIAIDGVNKAIPAGGGGGGSDVLDLSSYTNWSTLSAADQTAVQTALLVKHGGLIFTRTERGDDTDNSNYHFVNIAVADGNPSSGPFEQLKELDISINKSTYEFNKYELTKFRVLDTDRAGYDAYYAPTDYTVLRATKPWAYYASPDFAFDQLVDNETIKWDNSGHIKTDVGGSSITPSVTVDNSDTSAGGYYLRATNSDIYTMLNTYYSGATAHVSMHLTIHNTSEDVDYEQTLTADLPAVSDGNVKWRKYNAVSIQLGASNTQTVSWWIENTGQVTLFGGSTTFNGVTISGDITVSIATQYTPINANYLPIDNSTITINNGKIQAAVTFPTTIKANRIELPSSSFKYFQLDENNQFSWGMGGNIVLQLNYSGLYSRTGNMSLGGTNSTNQPWKDLHLSGNVTNGDASKSIAIGDLIDRNPAPTATPGTYVLKCTVDANGDPTYSWVAE